MKSFSHLAIVSLMFLLLCCCQHHKGILFKWASTCRECDALTISIDSAWASGEPAALVLKRIDVLDSVSRRCGDSQSRGRYYLLKTLLASATEAPLEDIIRYDSLARTFMDSTRFPYDHARLNIIKHSVFCSDFIVRYHRLMAAKKFAEERGDRFLMAEALTTLGEYSWIYGDTVESLSFLKRAQSIYHELKLHHREEVMEINKNLVEGDSTAVIRGLEKMVAISKRKTGPDRIPTVNEIMLYQLTGDTAALETAAQNPGLSNGMRLWAIMSVASIYWGNGKSATVDSLILRGVPLAKEIVEDGHETGDKRYFNLASYAFIENADRLERTNEPDSAIGYLKLAYSAENEYRSHNGFLQGNSVARSWMEEALNNQEKLNKRNHMLVILWWSLATGILVIVIFSIWIVLSHRLHRHRLRQKESELENEKMKTSLEKERRELLSSTLAMTEKDNVLQTIIEEVSRMESNGSISSPDARALDSAIRPHLSGKKEWEQFKVMFDKVHPSFLAKLKNAYPRLTEGDLHMAVYVKVGMDSKQIARMLMLAPGSVKLKRHRLREHMEIPADASLEDILRNID